MSGDCGADWLNTVVECTSNPAMTAEDGNDVDDTLCAADLEFNPRRPAETDAGFGAIAGFGGNSVVKNPEKKEKQTNKKKKIPKKELKLHFKC